MVSHLSENLGMKNFLEHGMGVNPNSAAQPAILRVWLVEYVEICTN